VFGFCLDGIASWASWACLTFDFFVAWLGGCIIYSFGHGPGPEARSC
jgi:hypothetical protein